MSFDPAVVASRLAELVAGYPRAALAVALSGGADSAALLHAVATVARGLPGLRLRALHVDHGLQAAARKLREAASEVSAQCGVPLQVLEVRVASGTGESIEAAARDARYAALALALAPGETLLTAHHREDQAETVLLQMLRGAGLPGIAAMPAVARLGSGTLVRPLLDMPRAALLDYSHEHGLPHHPDPMNADPRYDRAYVRAEVWPRLVQRWPAAGETLTRAARHAAEAQSLLDAYVREDIARVARGAALDVPQLLALPEARRNAVLRGWFASHGVRSPPARRLALVERELLRARGPNGPRLAWDGVEVRRFDTALHLIPPLESLPSQAALGPDAPVALGGLGTLVLAPAEGHGLAAARIALPLAVRPRSGGERLQLAPGGARRAVKDLLREARVPPWVRERLPMLWDGGRLVGVALPGGAWLACDLAAGAGEAGYVVQWRDAPAGFALEP